MFSKAALVAAVAAFAVQVNGHAIINNALGVTGTPARSDVQTPRYALRSLLLGQIAQIISYIAPQTLAEA
jgi:hypothetical protein